MILIVEVMFVCLYGEGYGNRIQKVGKHYLSDSVGFILFDVRVGKFWLKRIDVENIASKMGVPVVPIIGAGTLLEAIEFVREGFHSSVGSLQAEGLVCRPKVEMFDRQGKRIIAKIKSKDFLR